MPAFDAADLLSAIAWVKVSGIDPERRGVIKAVVEPFCSASASQVIAYSIYVVRLDDGRIVRVAGYNLKRIQSCLRSRENYDFAAL